jgi:tyrosyl-tRNA synthetase
LVQALLRNPSDYWISVINAGRAFQLSRVLAAVGEASPEAGHVLAALMHVADVLSIAAADASTVACTPAQQPLTELALEYLRGAGVDAAGLVVPELQATAAVSLRLKADDGGKWEPEAELLLSDAQADVQRKLKRAFCEPGNVDFCPPISLAEELVMAHGGGAEFVVARADDNGGPQRFATAAALRDAFKSGELHPGDLKPSVRDGANAVLERVRAAVAADKSLKEAEKELAKVLKRKK